MARNHTDQGPRAREARSNRISANPAAAKTARPPRTPNFTILSTEPDAPAELLDILRYGEVRCAGKNAWLVAARREDWIHDRHHVVVLRGGTLVCGCRQGWARRMCAHVVAVRHLATVPEKASVGAQIRLFDDTVPVVRAASAGGSR